MMPDIVRIAMRAMPNALRGQRGAALIMFMVILFLGTSWYFLSALNAASSNVDLSRRQISSRVLAEAKQALLGYVATLAASDKNPGRLPCPEALDAATTLNPDDDGVAAAFCTLPAVGRLPWRTLGVSKLTDGYGEPLWYVVSPGFALPSVAGPLLINSNTPAQIIVDGASAAVALIIAPGPPMSVQSVAGCAARVQTRAVVLSSNIPLDHRDYLECENATSPPDGLFVTSSPFAYVIVNSKSVPVSTFNDQVAAITPADLWNLVEPVVAKRIETQIVPELVKSFNGDPLATWKSAGVTPTAATAATPVFPYAVPWGNLAALPPCFPAPCTSLLEGSSSPKTYQGLLPLFSHPSDPAFIYWDLTQGVSVTKKSGTGSVNSFTCSVGIARELSCSITYTGGPVVAVRGVARNVLNTFGRLDLSGVTGFSAPPSITEASIFNNAQVRMEINGPLPDNSPSIGTRVVTVPIALFADHQLLDESNATYGWFVGNRWHQLIYYAVAEDNSPNGESYSCVENQAPLPPPPLPQSCLRLTPADAVGVGKQRAILILAGRSLSGTPRPNGTLIDFVDGENANGDTVFAKLPANKTFNDRIVVLSARP